MPAVQRATLLVAAAAAVGPTRADAAGCAPRSAALDVAGGAYAPTGDACPVHDPAAAFDGEAYYVFSTDIGATAGGAHLPIRCSPDGTAWRLCGSVFPGGLPAWLPAAVPGVTGLWAPDVSFFNGTWWLYYAASSFGSQASAIGLATAATLDPAAPGGGWTDRGLVFASAKGGPFNAIDPSHALDTATGQRWLTFGSFWQGIYALPLDVATGKPAPGASPTHVAQRAAPDALEASSPFFAAGVWWLAASWNFCCRGVNSTYEVRLGRAPAAAAATGASASPVGPYVDANGTALLAGGGTRVAGGGHGWAAAGGQSPLRSVAWPGPAAAAGAPTAVPLVMHAYDGVSGDPWLQIVSLTWPACGADAAGAAAAIESAAGGSAGWPNLTSGWPAPAMAVRAQ